MSTHPRRFGPVLSAALAGLLFASCTVKPIDDDDLDVPSDGDETPNGDGDDTTGDGDGSDGSDEDGKGDGSDGDADEPTGDGDGDTSEGDGDADMDEQPSDPGDGDGGDGGDGGLEPNYQVYLGSTHAHTEYSFDAVDMGGGTPADAYEAAREAGADFYIVTDHVDRMYGDGAHTPEQFQHAKEMAAMASDDSFVAMAGFEFHLDENEMNTLDVDLTQEIHELSWQVSPVEYLDFLADFPGAVSQWNHPGRKESEFNHYEGYTEARDARVMLLEVLNGEDEVYDQSFQTALDAGWHVAPSAGHDTHDAQRFQIAPRTGVLTEALTQEAILEAFRARRVFASQEPDRKVWYHVNGKVMGSTIAASDRYELTVRTEGSQALSTIEIVTEGGEVVASGEPSSDTWTHVLEGEARPYFYARLVSADGAVTWTAPVWTGD